MPPLFEPLSSFEIEAALLSLKVAGAAMLVTAPLALGLAWLLARGSFPGKWMVETLVNLPLVLPPVVTGLVLLMLFGVRGPIGGWLHDVFGVTLAFHWTGAALAAGIMALPLVARPMRLSLEGVDRGLEQAASSLGAPPWHVFARITLPLAAPGMIAGLVLGFARAFGEFGATVTFAGAIPGETQTLPVAIYATLQRADGEPAAIRLAVVSVAVCVLALVLAEWTNRRSLRGRPRA
ncbi:Molybdenum transport system permease protein ModB [Brevundimonas sp. NIBR10]|uniref:molybdate ABC transporter permease subunit n=1 Tax=Brevundimonas sp. NIBR10 TaxID=3015997 RepID=UPI0022F17A5C|nr:molybdate ABC transporter permease subunit [Brevundimonas sp. NIBR10]WGM47733.1 Molybdenum transport system permease protein ModB [Brevundimonas sp. NIBR10]